MYSLQAESKRKIKPTLPPSVIPLQPSTFHPFGLPLPNSSLITRYSPLNRSIDVAQATMTRL